MPRARRPRPWAQAAARYAVPHLPGGRLALDTGLIMQPVGLIARGISAAPGHPRVILHPLYLPLDTADTGWKLGHECWIPGYLEISGQSRTASSTWRRWYPPSVTS